LDNILNLHFDSISWFVILFIFIFIVVVSIFLTSTIVGTIPWKTTGWIALRIVNNFVKSIIVICVFTFSPLFFLSCFSSSPSFLSIFCFIFPLFVFSLFASIYLSFVVAFVWCFYECVGIILWLVMYGCLYKPPKWLCWSFLITNRFVMLGSKL
jgi:hypothetical protein